MFMKCVNPDEYNITDSTDDETAFNRFFTACDPENRYYISVEFNAGHQAPENKGLYDEDANQHNSSNIEGGGFKLDLYTYGKYKWNSIFNEEGSIKALHLVFPRNSIFDTIITEFNTKISTN